MQSCDNHINDPMRKIEIDLINRIPPFRWEYVTQAHYDRMEIHDPGTVYMITDSSVGKVYLGDILVSGADVPRPKHFISVNTDGNYDVYTAIYTDDGSCFLILLSTYDTAEGALKALQQFKNTGGTDEMSHKIYIALSEYITKMNGINETIIAIISLMGYRDDSRLQYLCERALSYGVNAPDRDLPILLKQDLRNEPSFPNLVKLYADIYDVFILYDLFKGKQYLGKEADELNLSEPVQRIVACRGLI